MCKTFFSVGVANIVNNFDLRWDLILSLALDVCCVSVPSAGRRVVPAPSESGAMVPVEDNRPPAPDGPDKPQGDRQTSKLKLDSIFQRILRKILRRSSTLASWCRSRGHSKISSYQVPSPMSSHEISLEYCNHITSYSAFTSRALKVQR